MKGRETMSDTNSPCTTQTKATTSSVVTEVEIRPGMTISTHLGCRILLVEDGLDNARLISTQLSKSGAEVVIAENGQIGVDLAMASVQEGRPYDLILMDMNMPVMDGYTATSSLRQKGYIGPIIAVTSNADPEDRSRCLKAGCDEYAPKPVKAAELVSLARDWSDSNPDDLAETDVPDAIVSSFSDDPSRRDQLESFISKLPLISDAVDKTFERRDSLMLAAITRQLKGAAKGYGFGQISQAAAGVENAVCTGSDRESLWNRVQKLSAMCRRAKVCI
jgi:CheY-like chemotaxis protein